MTLTVYTAGVFLGNARAFHVGGETQIAADFLRHGRRLYDQLVEAWPDLDAATLAKMAEDIASVEALLAGGGSK